MSDAQPTNGQAQQSTPKSQPRGITRIGVKNFKSIQEGSIEIRPLTVLAGANSSGKSSIMQPLLLLKQTLESPYDEGALKLRGEHVQVDNPFQVIHRPSKSDIWGISLDLTGFGENLASITKSISNLYKASDYDLRLVETSYTIEDQTSTLQPSYKTPEINSQIPNLAFAYHIPDDIDEKEVHTSLEVVRHEIFLGVDAYLSFKNDHVSLDSLRLDPFRVQDYIFNLARIIHITGIRNRPEQTYRSINWSQPSFRGIFDAYFASVLLRWSMEQDQKLIELGKMTSLLGIASYVTAVQRNFSDIEIRIGRTLNSDASDMVNIADVGIGVSQVLPVLVALLVASPGQLVYIEQPELHLHPRAQHKLAEFIAEAAARGVRVVIETHSDLLLLGIQTAVVEKKIAPEEVILHWFKRSEDGLTTIKSATLDENGAYGDWDEDFAETDLNAQSRYLDAVAAHEFGE